MGEEVMLEKRCQSFLDYLKTVRFVSEDSVIGEVESIVNSLLLAKSIKLVTRKVRTAWGDEEVRGYVIN